MTTSTTADNYDWVHAIIWPVINALFGIVIFEWAWAVTKPIREIDEARDSKYPAFRRYDAHKWARWKFYPGAMTLLPLRMFLAFSNLLMCWVIALIFTIGSNIDNGKPLARWRKKTLFFIYWCQTALEGFYFSYRWTKRFQDFDYQEYLGKDYKTS